MRWKQAEPDELGDVPVIDQTVTEIQRQNPDFCTPKLSEPGQFLNLLSIPKKTKEAVSGINIWNSIETFKYPVGVLK